ncbi:hypothetical protein SAY87_010351 [Trapa incisa]|uniref:Fungal lipase-type domain-containing protein n=2 Tax=Trapa TaxID=22665 RepID=A0AAN7M9A6_TRANT|nr:hypothetical protein SAY87_010351 [Trapa incisa]KAK4794017.1 hypothetical protein SAY86_012011 [Trapa natans]
MHMASCNEEEGVFCRNYLVLKPQEASFFDVLRFLIFSSDVSAKRRAVYFPEDEEGPWAFKRRWIIFISLLLQKILLLTKDRLARVGYLLETWLNLLSINGGVLGLLRNILKGKVQKPDPDSALFRSSVGFTDGRVDLDSHITREDPKYKPSLSMMAAKLAYENGAFVRSVITQHWKMECLGHYSFWNDSQQEPTTGATVVRDGNLIIVAFRGTRPFQADDWRVDVDISWYEIDGVGNAHKGFMNALGVQMGDGGRPNQIRSSNDGRQYAYYELRDLLKEWLTDSNGEGEEKRKFIVTGHSLGAALAILFASVLAIQDEESLLSRLEGVYTYAQPRVGDEQFGKYVMQKFKPYGVDYNYKRFVYANDIVPRVPFDDKVLMFKHFGACHFFTSWFYRGMVLEEEPNKNYFSLLWVIPKILNAVWEFVRSFILPCIEGPNYRETFVLKSLRLMGIFTVPGIPAHSPQDYVNLTRLGDIIA